MSVIIVSNPVVTEDGIVKNLFAGFLPVEFKFKREDLQIVSLGLGTDSNIRITIDTDLTSVLDIGDIIYVGATGIGGYIYDDSAAITAITASTIDVEIPYIENSVSGYINYLKNWYLECKLVDPDNSDIKILPFSLIDDGDNAGNVTIDVSIANDKNIQYFEFVSQLLEDSVIVFKFQYKQVYENSSSRETFILIDQELILVYATKQPEYEAFLNELEEPKLWKQYPYGIVLNHSAENSDGAGISVVYDELDINQSTIESDNFLVSFNANEQGHFFINQFKSTGGVGEADYNEDTEYVKFKASYTSLADFDANDFSADFKIT